MTPEETRKFYGLVCDALGPMLAVVNAYPQVPTDVRYPGPDGANIRGGYASLLHTKRRLEWVLDAP